MTSLKDIVLLQHAHRSLRLLKLIASFTLMAFVSIGCAFGALGAGRDHLLSWAALMTGFILMEFVYISGFAREHSPPRRRSLLR